MTDRKFFLQSTGKMTFNGTAIDSSYLDKNMSTNESLNNSIQETQVQTFDLPILPLWQRILFITLYVVMFLIATGGNVIVIWIVMAHKRMRTVTNYFLVNLAVADTLISLLNTPFTSSFLLYQDWWYGELYCKFTIFISICTICASVLTFMAIAIDRYVAIIHPLRPRLTGRVILAIILIWTASVILASPNLIYAITETYPYGNSSITTCFVRWPDGVYSNTDLGYNMLIMAVTYVLPMTTLAITYTRIGIELWGSRAIGEYTPVQYERNKSKRRVVKMMIVVVVIFGICWFPYHLYFILASTTDIANQKNIQLAFLVIYWFAMSNSMYNPIIYCWMNAKFRHGFTEVFCCLPCHPCKQVLNRARQERNLFPSGTHYTTNEKLLYAYLQYKNNNDNDHSDKALPGYFAVVLVNHVNVSETQCVLDELFSLLQIIIR
ncbi:hypothetical protein KUTeg_003729 [Tegillarca granosa]|uniref:G-protein coupled receptors family 1 profile domain-containing protein n=1 Tax=Tegillarca granosa TaxID=220873 RepID=A0ABQ9FN19_TEGGR|nr:hypothetical protein KUTeg_003729 [Tegillarca granosa]